MLVHVHVKLTKRHLAELANKLGFTPDRATVRQWAKESILGQLETPADRAARLEPRPLLELPSDNGQ